MRPNGKVLFLFFNSAQLNGSNSTLTQSTRIFNGFLGFDHLSRSNPNFWVSNQFLVRFQIIFRARSILRQHVEKNRYSSRWSSPFNFFVHPLKTSKSSFYLPSISFIKNFSFFVPFFPYVISIENPFLTKNYKFDLHSSSSQFRSSITKRTPRWDHGVTAKLQVTKKGTRVGKSFYECASWLTRIQSLDL